MESVAAFTDTYLPTINGVSYTLSTWRNHWERRGGEMTIVYPNATTYNPEDDELGVPSIPFPFYDGFRIGLPKLPLRLGAIDLVHVHTPFFVGYGGIRYAARHDLPIVASYHTPITEYADYLAIHPAMTTSVRKISLGLERWFFNHADTVLTPSAHTAAHLTDDLQIAAPVRILPNGVDTDRFQPTETVEFIETYDLPTDRPLIGYTGRHGYEKKLTHLIKAAADLDVTVVLGGNGPAKPTLEELATKTGTDVYFLGFLDRSDLPAFYSSLDLFAFPSPVETQGIVALEAIACGTPVVAANAGALTETIIDGTTGYHYEPGNLNAFRSAIKHALIEREELHENCLRHRDTISVEHTIDQLHDLYSSF